jgi:hypothetical protein
VLDKTILSGYCLSIEGTQEEKVELKDFTLKRSSDFGLYMPLMKILFIIIYFGIVYCVCVFCI